MSEYILELDGITKLFPGVKALDDVHFQLKPGEIHALMGENGAGKSTFIKVITGVHKPDEGTMRLEGSEVRFQSTRDSQKAGIAAIYQHTTCYPDLSVTENIFLGHEKVDPLTKRILWKEMHTEAKALLEKLGASFDPKSTMGLLSVAQQQMVEIAKALSTDAKIIIMDEPTAALTARESEELYKLTEKLRSDGASIIFISHRFEDMYRLADRVTVLRDSQYIGTWNVNEISNEDLIIAMVGREINQLFPKRAVELGEEALRVEKLSKAGLFKDISFSVRRGEIVSLTGLVGAGRSEICEAICGVCPGDEGKILVEGKEVTINRPTDALAAGIGYLPEDRQKQGLILKWDLAKNITLSNLGKFTKRGFLNTRRENEEAARLAQKVNVKAQSIFDLASSLSGGNQQKVVVAKILASDMKVIILDECTKGVDVGAKAAMYEIMCDLAELGYAIVMVSSEMPEVLGMSDRIVVIKEGRITATMNTKEASQESILVAAMAGGAKETEVSAG